MVDILVKQLRCSVRAEVKESNLASIRIAESVGMVLVDRKDGVLYFSKS
jgi:RimJ/RimL family protein N-acetyltransferase